MPNTITEFIDTFFAIGLFINAALFIPQGVRLYRLKQSKDVSLITFSGFCFMQLTSVLYGYIHKDYILMYGFLLSFLLCVSVLLLIIKYR